MPSRIIREGIITSENINALSIGAELFYRRLMSIADDFGRYFAHPSILRANCFPLKLDSVSDSDISTWLKECQKHGVLIVYNNGKHLQILKFGQQTRATKSKFPEPDNQMLNKCLADDKQMLNLVGDVVECEVGFDSSNIVEEAKKTSNQLRAEKLLGKRPTTAYDKSEIAAWKIAKPIVENTLEADWLLLEAYYAAPQEETYRRKNYATLLNNWNGEIDRAKSWKQKKVNSNVPKFAGGNF